MTSTFDNLGGLRYRVEEDRRLQPLVEAVYDEAINQINKVNPKILNWEDWSKKKLEMYKKLYPRNNVFMAKSEFLSDTHTLLDHGDYHFKCVKASLDRVIHYVYDWLRKREGFGVDLGYLHSRTRKQYPKIMEELKKLLKSGVLQPSEWSRLTKKWIESSNLTI